jgi:hypothetical protein
MPPSSQPNADHLVAPEPGHPVLPTVFFCALAFVCFLRLQAIWPIGLYQDDAAISLWKTEGQLAGKSVFGKSHDFFIGLMKYQGRFKPISCYIIGPLHIAIEDNRVLYRGAQAMAQLIGLGVFAFLCLRLSRSHWYWGLVILLFASFYEIRYYHDAAYGQFAIFPFVILLGSLTCYFAYCCSERTGSVLNGYLWLTVLFSSLSLCTMELALPFCGAAALFMLGGSNPWRSRIIRVILAGAPIMLFSGIDAYLRSKSIYTGTQVGNLSPAVFGHTYFGQVISALPLSYFHYDPQHLFSGSWRWTTDSLAAIAGGLAAAVAFYLGSSGIRRPQGWQLPLLGLLLLLLPSAMISASLKYQRETSPGMGYLQTIFSYLGTGILAVLLVTTVADKLRQVKWLHVTFRALASLCLGVIMATTLLCANRVAQSVNTVWRFPREKSEVWLHVTRAAPGAQEAFVRERNVLDRWETPAHLFLNRGAHGNYYTSSGFVDPPPVLPPQASVVRFRFPARAEAADLTLIIGSFHIVESPTQSRVVALVVSTDQAKLQQTKLQLVAAEKNWEFTSETKLAHNGYYYRLLELPADHPDLALYALAVL